MSNMKKKRGRPPKNKDLNLLSDTNKFNINKSNIFPPNKINFNETAVIIDEKKTGYLVYIECDKPEILEAIFDILKAKTKQVTFIFTHTGIIFTKNKDNQSMTNYECKLFPNNLLKYEMIDNKKNNHIVAINIDIDNIHKIIKTIKKGSIFSLTIFQRNAKSYLKLKEGNDMYTIDLKSITSYKLMKYVKDTKYDVIFMFEAEEFKKICKKIELFSPEFNIDYSFKKIDNINFNYKINEISYKSVMVESPKFIFIKKSKKLIGNKFKMSSMIKYVKCAKFSTIVKIYLSSNHPLIIEYDVGNLGTFQIFISVQF